MNLKQLPMLLAIVIGIAGGVLATNYFLIRRDAPPAAPAPAAAAPSKPAPPPQPPSGEGFMDLAKPLPEAELREVGRTLDAKRTLDLTWGFTDPTAEVAGDAALTREIGVNYESLYETRAHQSAKNPPSSPSFPSFRVVLRFYGPLVQSSLKWGNLRVTKAVDDGGNDLIISRAANFGSQQRTNMIGFMPIEPPRVSQGGVLMPAPDTAPRPTQHWVKIVLSPPKRAAQSVREIEGTVQFLRSSGKGEVKYDKLKGRIGQKLEDPMLEGAKLNVELLPGRRNEFIKDTTQALTLRVSGQIDAILKVVFFDKDGKQIRMQRLISTATSGGVEDWPFDVGREITDDITMVIGVAKDARVVDVPFRVTDIRLP